MKSLIYQGEVSHARLTPVRHSFRYPVHFYAFDLDELAEIDRRNPLFGYNRLRPVAIHDKDYLLPGSRPIREKLADVLARAGAGSPPGQVVLVTAARYFNYIFNPISFFYCYGRSGALSHLVAQVNNTFGEMHLYVLAGEEAAAGDGRGRFQVAKQFHVSPFFPRRGRYEFLLSPPAEQLDNTIRYHLDDQLALIARIHGRAAPLTPGRLAGILLRHPLRASLTMPRILWQALRLYVQRKLPVFHKPVPDNPMTVRPVPPTWADRLGSKVVCNFFSRLPQGELRLTTPDGAEHLFGTPGATPRVAMRVHEHGFFRRVMLSGDIGFGEAYTAGEWSSDDLPALLTLFARNAAVMDDRRVGTAALGRAANYVRHLLRPNTVRGSDRNIRAHYDLSNAFFQLLLDPTMTYSCGLFLSDRETLEEAQHNKLRAIIDKAALSRDDHVLEIGCGWGSFAIEAVRRTGCRVTGITISEEQLKLARERVRAAGLEARIEIRRCDYRHIEGRFSRVVSIEMLEAVGHAGLVPFFAACNRALLPGGRAVIQVIDIADRKYRVYRSGSDWIRKHIFPGGHLPSVGAMMQAMAEGSELNLESLEHFGGHYVRTLDLWRETLLEKRAEILALGFDATFLRSWEYYFAYCRAGFAAQTIDLAHMVLTRPDREG